ncbi:MULTISPECIES: spore germination protein [unclassified Paenibacillus]|uniref:spore germination protein n=1 Tax=unclassified Paenibacillus TaxID=185978 RepID=UPI001B43567C|nr:MULTISPECIES: spore germination protein [unclassified Paenibacillus]MBP1155188.1 stage V sporulation protein AF [Paenibacillus sp. PvP091]MBP1169428.1 stage V sporulation protein AF [Paenibacillus sp. PvR098]MBP2440456.1 stage V sporulation protein AF [Paenibacillus sp. PvP052]
MKSYKKAKLLKGRGAPTNEGEDKQIGKIETRLAIDRDGNIIESQGTETESTMVSKESQGQSGDESKGPSSFQKEWTLTAEEHELMKDTSISEDFKRLKRQLEEQVGLNKSFDVVFREMMFGGQNTGIFYYNGFAKDTVLTDILVRLSYADQTYRGGRHEAGNRDQDRDNLDVISLFDQALIPHIQVIKTNSLKEAIDNVAMGGTAFFFEGQKEAVLVDAKSFPVRSTEEPDLERVVRGSRDGFVETLLTNVTLVRRRIRDPRLKLEIMQAGKRTQTDICIGYIQDICDKNLVEAVRDKIKQVDVDGMPLAEKQLEEAIIGKGWNPYPMVRFSERPDVVSAHLLEGHLILFVDTSPSVMILPTTFFHHVQHAEEYRQTPFVGSYLRWVRFIGIAASLFLLPLWMLIVTSPELKPAGLEFIGPQEPGRIPLLGQFLIAELGLDLMRMAAVHTPTPLATAMGLVAAILIGDVAVKTGLFVNEVILYLAVAAVGTFATPSYELSLANRLARLGLLLAAAIFKVPGLIIGSTLLVLMLALQRSYNTPYLWPFIPFNAKAMADIMVRRPFMSMKTRLSITKPTDSTRQPQP